MSQNTNILFKKERKRKHKDGRQRPKPIEKKHQKAYVNYHKNPLK